MKKLFAILGLGALLGFTAHAQVTSPTLFTPTNYPATLSSNVVVSVTNAIPLTKNCCIAIAGRFNTSAGAGNISISGSFSADGVNYGLSPFTLTGTLATAVPGMNTVTFSTNFSQAFLSGYAGLNLNTMTNTGPGTATNLSLIVNRPTLNTATY